MIDQNGVDINETEAEAASREQRMIIEWEAKRDWEDMQADMIFDRLLEK